MVNASAQIETFLRQIPLFADLSPSRLHWLGERLTKLRYPMGQVIATPEQMPERITILSQGQWRLLGYDVRSQQTIPLTKLEPGAMVGWLSHLRDIPCEGAIAASDSVGLSLEIADFHTLLSQERSLLIQLQQQPHWCEVSDILGQWLDRQADGATNLSQFTAQALPMAQVQSDETLELLCDRVYFASSNNIKNHSIGDPIETETHPLSTTSNLPPRILSFPRSLLFPSSTTQPEIEVLEDIPVAPQLKPKSQNKRSQHTHYPYYRGQGTFAATLACFQMLCQYLEIPYRPNNVRRVVANQVQKTQSISLEFCAAVADLIELQAQILTLPASVIPRLPEVAMVQWQDSFAVVYEARDRQIILAVPEEGILFLTPAEFQELWGESGQVLLLKKTATTSQKKFNLSWFLPAIRQYKIVLIEVLVASFFVQLFGLANPLMTQFIINQVVATGDTQVLPALATLLVVITIFEAVLTALRTYLFTDTTNRIDLSLGTEVIDHLLRLPLSYFNRRPVGELSSRVNELENIRSFLTGTALTVVLDAVFSIVYIAVMIIYSPLLTLVALSVIPIIMLMTFIVSPIIRQRIRKKAECNAQTQSYLVEVLSGIETVKAQNIELRSRMSWQEKYGRYIAAGFKAIQLSAASSAFSNFLNKLSSLLVLCVGAYLVVNGEMNLGQLIAFRIIAGYVTSPLLRLSQLWQNFQETALSIERLSDILDTPQEDEGQRDNLPMPALAGTVKYENVSFRFAQSGPMQLSNINVEIPQGKFIGIVGQSGSGKSTLVKLLSRLYDRESGRILIDNYDIHKVELYSLRRQIGIVPQNTLLFDGTVQENIALCRPEATFEEIVEAAKTAAAHDFIMDLPSGYNTRVGERGSALSGGQRQRIAIARTILQNPQLLILDEATSALDYETEWQVCHNLMAVFQGRTVLFITHRLSTIQNADSILMLDRGVIIEQGTHQDLMTQKGSYFCLYRQQEAQS